MLIANLSYLTNQFKL